MARRLNPFVSGKPVPPSYFIGRKEIIDNCRNRLAGSVCTSIAISGEHGVGKTSLLYYLMILARQEKWGQPNTHNLFVYLNCGDLGQFTQTRFWRRVLEELKQIEENPSLQQQLEALLKQSELDGFHIQRLLRWLNQRQFSLILLLDSFTRIVKSTSSTSLMIVDFLSSLRALTNLPDFALTMLTVTRDPLNILCADIIRDYPGSHFYNNFAFESLGPFDAAEIESLFEQAQGRSGVSFDQNNRDLLDKMAGGHPALLQMVSYHLFEAFQHGSLNNQAYKKVIEEFIRTAQKYFEPFWKESTALERTLFVLVILLNLAEPSALDMDITPKEIRLQLQRYERDLMRLMERGLIRRKGESYQIFSSIFTWWIVGEVNKETESELGNRYKTITEESLRQSWQILKRLAPFLTLDWVTQTLIERSSPMTLTILESQTREIPQNPAKVSPKLSRYELGDELGRGSYGIVYKAQDTLLDRPVAIKLIRSELTTSLAESRELLLKEARAASKLQHPNIMIVHDVAEVDEDIYLVMEYLEGQPLSSLLKEEKRLPLKQVVAFVDQAASALDYAHASGVIHRDIKPANLMITKNGSLKLTDFGVAKLIDGPGALQNTGLKGTVIYMSPEQVRRGLLDGRSDLFSLATVVFEMISGTWPWPDIDHLHAVMNHITMSPHRPLAQLNVPAAAKLESFFKKALAKDPNARYQKGQELVQALKAAIR